MDTFVDETVFNSYVLQWCFVIDSLTTAPGNKEVLIADCQVRTIWFYFSFAVYNRTNIEFRFVLIINATTESYNNIIISQSYICFSYFCLIKITDLDTKTQSQ